MQHFSREQVISFPTDDLKVIVRATNPETETFRDELAWARAELQRRAAADMLAALKLVCEMVDRPPPPNCSCHISPPCGDCVDYGGLREMFKAVDSAIAKAEG